MLSLENELNDTNYVPHISTQYQAKAIQQMRHTPTKGFPYPWDYETRYETQKDSLPGVLIIRDSFGKKLIPHLANQCKAIVGIWDNWHYGLNLPIIEAEKPNVVILEIVESNLKDILKYKNVQE
jgi:hypothetical protein